MGGAQRLARTCWSSSAPAVPAGRAPSPAARSTSAAARRCRRPAGSRTPPRRWPPSCARRSARRSTRTSSQAYVRGQRRPLHLARRPRRPVPAQPLRRPELDAADRRRPDVARRAQLAVHRARAPPPRAATARPPATSGAGCSWTSWPPRPRRPAPARRFDVYAERLVVDGRPRRRRPRPAVRRDQGLPGPARRRAHDRRLRRRRRDARRSTRRGSSAWTRSRCGGEDGSGIRMAQALGARRTPHGRRPGRLPRRTGLHGPGAGGQPQGAALHQRGHLPRAGSARRRCSSRAWAAGSSSTSRATSRCPRASAGGCCRTTSPTPLAELEELTGLPAGSAGGDGRPLQRGTRPAARTRSATRTRGGCARSSRPTPPSTPPAPSAGPTTRRSAPERRSSPSAGSRPTSTGHVLRPGRRAVPGLFAAGRATSGLAAWGYISGTSLGDGTFFGAPGRRGTRQVSSELWARARPAALPPSRRTNQDSSGQHRHQHAPSTGSARRTRCSRPCTTCCPGIAARADQAERDREVPAETIAELQEAGVFRMLQPKRWGGLEADPVEFYEVVRTIAVGLRLDRLGRLGRRRPPLAAGAVPRRRRRSDVWGEDPHTLVSSSYAPTGRLTPVEGGYRATGRWSFSSGCDHCSWVLLGAMRHGRRGQADRLPHHPACRAATTRSTTSGTSSACAPPAATTSSSTRPSSRRTARCRSTTSSALRCPGQAENTAPLYKLPFGTVFSYTITTPDHRDRDRAPTTPTSSGCASASGSRTAGRRSSSDAFAHVRVARAATDIDAAWLQLERNLDEEMRYADAGEEIPMELRLRARRDQVRGTERCVDAIALLFKNSGGHSLKNGNPIERAWRDGNAGSVHAANDTERWLAMYGKGAFGLPDRGCDGLMTSRCELHSLGYLVVETTDLDRWRELAVDVLGMAVGKGPDPDALYLRDRRPPRARDHPPRADRAAGRRRLGGARPRDAPRGRRASSRTPARRSRPAPARRPTSGGSRSSSSPRTRPAPRSRSSTAPRWCTTSC